MLLPADAWRTRPAERGRLPRAFSAVVFTLPPVSLHLVLVCLPRVSLAVLAGVFRGDLERTRVQEGPADLFTERDDERQRLVVALLALHEHLPLVHLLRHGAMMKAGDDNCLQTQYILYFDDQCCNINANNSQA